MASEYSDRATFVPTSGVTFLSSVHGRDRRKLRKISRRDLQAALKYGVKESTYPHPRTGAKRWKYTFRDIVYIVDEHGREVTSWVVPISVPTYDLLERDLHYHQKLREMFISRPSLVTSHTVCIIDHSGSMRTCDVPDFKTRADAVYGALALEFIGRRIDKGQARPSDMISVVEMASEAHVPIEFHPTSNVLYNILSKRIANDQHKPRGHGYYIPSLNAAAHILRKYSPGHSCALKVYLLSDGRPSDKLSVKSSVHLEHRIGSKAAKYFRGFGKNLSFTCVAFGEHEEKGAHNTLNTIVMYLRPGISDATLERIDAGSSKGLSQSMTNMSSTIESLRTILSMPYVDENCDSKDARRKKRDVAKAPLWKPGDPILEDDWLFISYDHNMLCPMDWDGKAWVRSKNRPPSGHGIAVRKRYFSKGAERLVFEVMHYTTNNEGELTFRWDKRYVAKESIYALESEREKEEFHTVFARTQHEARRLASKFNDSLQNAVNKVGVDISSVPAIDFLDCFAFEYENRYGTNGILVEPMIDHKSYTKWNSNNGFVRDINFVTNMATTRMAQAVHNVAMEHIEEGSEEDYSDGDSEESEEEKKAIDDAALEIGTGRIYDPKTLCDPSAVLQAFSHWSYRYTKRTKLVCDLQGVEEIANDGSRPLIRLTDPSIHHRRSRRGRRRYGRTDLGAKGMNRFYQSHLCSDVCDILGLNRRKAPCRQSDDPLVHRDGGVRRGKKTKESMRKGM